MLMTPEELTRRLAGGEDPLDLSIEKWERAIQNIHNRKTTRRDGKIDLYGDTCGLCAVYFSKSNADYICCAGCPLTSIQRWHCCDLYSIWREVIKSLSKKGFLAAAQAMLEALQEVKQ